MLLLLQILSVDTGNEFITFEAKGYEKISPQRKYNGISFQLIGRIKNTKTPFNVDIGVGDVIVPKAEKRKIPTQLEDFTAPEITTYSLESTIAEKLDAILGRLELTSRMKDFYDILPAFQETVRGIDVFLSPLWNAMINENEWLKRWDVGQQRWM